MRTNFHRQITVLAIGCFIALVESTHLAPQSATDKNGCTADVVGFTNEAAMPAGIIRITVPIVERGSVVPDDPAGFLNFSAGINEFRADKPGFLVGFHKLIQRGEPVGEDDSVVVQQQDMPSPSMLGGVVAVAEKAHILKRSDDNDTREYGIALGRVVFGSVVGKNDFIGDATVAGFQNGVDAGAGQMPLVIYGDNDGNVDVFTHGRKRTGRQSRAVAGPERDG